MPPQIPAPVTAARPGSGGRPSLRRLGDSVHRVHTPGRRPQAAPPARRRLVAFVHRVHTSGAVLIEIACRHPDEGRFRAPRAHFWRRRAPGAHLCAAGPSAWSEACIPRTIATSISSRTLGCALAVHPMHEIDASAVWKVGLDAKMCTGRTLPGMNLVARG
jgi:hypothetical protein